MITVYPVLCQSMRKNGITRRELAAILNVTKFALYLRMCGIKRWKLTEVVKICCFFRTHDAEHLFEKRGCSEMFENIITHFSKKVNRIFRKV